MVAPALPHAPAQAPGGVPRLMAHPFFKAIDWEQLREGRSTLPLLMRDRLFNSAGGRGIRAEYLIMHAYACLLTSDQL